VAEALEADELAVPLAAALKTAQDDAVRLLVPPQTDPTPPPPVPPLPGQRWREIKARDQLTHAEAVETLRAYLESLTKAQRERVRISWRVEDKD
jgi:hypothetical protein